MIVTGGATEAGGGQPGTQKWVFRAGQAVAGDFCVPEWSLRPPEGTFVHDHRKEAGHALFHASG
jgi:hypothetical protein